MRIVLACRDVDVADWLARVLGNAGISVVVLPDVDPSSPELKGAELLVLDADAAKALDDGGRTPRLLISARGATLDLDEIRGRFADILVVPTPEEEVVARVRHAMDR